MSKDDKKECDDKDFVIPTLILDDGTYVGVRHRPNHDAELCKMIPMKDAESVPAGIELSFRNKDGIYEIVSPGLKNGPARVTTNKYRKGWDNIFTQKGGVA